MNRGCSCEFRDCLFEKDILNIGLVYVDGKIKRCSSGLVFTFIPKLEIVIHYTAWYPRLVISLKFEKRRRLVLVDEPYPYSGAVLPVRYKEYLDYYFVDLENEEF
jgi:hypothetical protein